MSAPSACVCARYARPFDYEPKSKYSHTMAWSGDSVCWPTVVVMPHHSRNIKIENKKKKTIFRTNTIITRLCTLILGVLYLVSRPLPNDVVAGRTSVYCLYALTHISNHVLRVPFHFFFWFFHFQSQSTFICFLWHRRKSKLHHCYYANKMERAVNDNYDKIQSNWEMNSDEMRMTNER